MLRQFALQTAAMSAMMSSLVGFPFNDIKPVKTIRRESHKVPSQRRRAYVTGNNQRKIRKLRRQTGNY